MKARAVAGDTERATTFLNELQKVDWRRYGQSGRSKKDLRQMRMRLEKEQGAGPSAQSRPRRILRYRFFAAVSALESGRPVLQGAEHAGAHQYH